MVGGAVGPVGVLACLAHRAACAGLGLERRIEFRLEPADVVCGVSGSVVGPGQRSLGVLPGSVGVRGIAACVLLILPGPV